MNRDKALRKLSRKALKALPCPFCGRKPSFEFTTDDKHSKHGSFGHFAIRKGCCEATASGQTELFFCNNFKAPNYSLWFSMGNRLIDCWNTRNGEHQ